MRNIFLATALAAFVFSSCNIVKVAHGDAYPEESTVEVGSQRNHIFICGLISGGKTNLRAKDYVGDREDYIVKTKITFVNGLVAFLTGSIYTPTTTSFHIPLSSALLSSKRAVDYESKEDAIFVKPKKEKKRRFIEPNTTSTKDTEKLTNEVADKKENEDITVTKKSTRKREYTYPQAEQDLTYLKEQEKDNPKKITIIEEPSIPETTIPVIDSQNASIMSQPEKIALENIDKKSATKKAPTNTNTTGSSKEYKGVIYFNNGAKMNGIITEYESGNVSIKIPGGSVLQSNMKEIKRIDPL